MVYFINAMSTYRSTKLNVGFATRWQTDSVFIYLGVRLEGNGGLTCKSRIKICELLIQLLIFFSFLLLFLLLLFLIVHFVALSKDDIALIVIFINYG